MKLKWTRRALSQFKNAEMYIAKEDPQAAKAVTERIAEAIHLLLNQPQLGRPGRIRGTREWVVKQTPYLIAYAIEDDYLVVLRVIHSKRHWPVYKA